MTRSPSRRQFLSFLRHCWTHLPTYISKVDPFKCTFHDASFDEKRWIFSRSPSGLLKNVALHIVNYLNGAENVNDGLEAFNSSQKFPHFEWSSVATMLSDIFTNKRSYANNGINRKLKSELIATPGKAVIKGYIDGFVKIDKVDDEDDNVEDDSNEKV